MRKKDIWASVLIGIITALAACGPEPALAYSREAEKAESTYVVYEEIPLDADLQIRAQEICGEYGVSFPFFLAVCESESDFDTEAVGDSGKSRGLMQINRCNWERYDLDASMVYDNMEIGIRMLSELIDDYKDIDAVVMAYKCGRGRANRLISEGVRLACVERTVDRMAYWSEVTG